MQSLAVNGYTADQVRAQLHAPQGRRKLAFRYELLDKTNTKIGDLTNVLGSSVSHDTNADVKRTAKFNVLDDGSIDFLSNRIKPFVRLWIPSGYNTGGWAEFPQGVFLLSTPPRVADPSNGTVTRDVEAYDQTQILIDDKVIDRYTVSAGTNYITAVNNVLGSAGITQTNLTPTTKTLPADLDWDPATTKLQIINDLLQAINYKTLTFDENGTAVAEPYQSPSVRPSEYTYINDGTSVIVPDVTQTLDLFSIPNEWVLIVSEADRPPLRSVYTNSNANSKTSTVNVGRTIVDIRTNEQAPDQATLDARANRIAYEASQVYEGVEFNTAIMPMHADNDVFTLQYSRLGISDKYSEQSWSFDFRAGAVMKHIIRRVVTI